MNTDMGTISSSGTNLWSLKRFSNGNQVNLGSFFKVPVDMEHEDYERSVGYSDRTIFCKVLRCPGGGGELFGTEELTTEAHHLIKVILGFSEIPFGVVHRVE